MNRIIYPYPNLADMTDDELRALIADRPPCRMGDGTIYLNIDMDAMDELRAREPRRDLRFNRLDDYYGLCPACHAPPQIINIAKTHVGICKDHMMAWVVGYNLFPNWQTETEEIWQSNTELVARAQEVKPHFYPGIADDRDPCINKTPF